MNLNEIYSAQSYRDKMIIKEKRENKDYAVKVAYIADDDNMIAVLVDGHHSLEAAILDGVEPEIEIIESEYKTLESYVIAFGDLSNPVNIITKKEIW
jgi:hypothetical protein